MSYCRTANGRDGVRRAPGDGDAFPQGHLRKGGATRPGRCNAGAPAGAGNRQVSDGSLPYLPPCVGIWLILNDLSGTGV